jgi:glycosyltransferase involved in cell wall biosynthesis
MASGIPVIGTNVGGVSDIIINEYNGFLVPEKSVSDLENKILELFINKDLATKFELNGINTVATKFSWCVISEYMVKLYKNLCNGDFL